MQQVHHILTFLVMRKKLNPGQQKSPVRKLSPQDRALWACAVTDVSPLKHGKTHPEKKEPIEKTEIQMGLSVDEIWASAPNNKMDKTLNNFEHGQAPGLDRRTKTRLRRGQVSIEARIDLHGLTQPEAHAQLLRFLASAFERGVRSVLVITGKGLRANGEIGILRSSVPRWLNQKPARDWIKAFDHAINRDGGEGALYVLLRRRK